MRFTRWFILTAALVAMIGSLAPRAAGADPYPQRRDGFYLGGGFGGGAGAVSVTGNGFSVSSDRQGGAVGSLRMGWGIRPQLSVGMESNAWARTQNGARVSFSVATLGATYYPNPEQGIYLRAGVGGGSEKLAATSGQTTATASKSGFGFTGGVGYEMRLSPHWALGPALDFGYVSVDEAGTTISANYVNFTAAMNWYFF
jgi:hypothetical protein